MIRRLRRRLAAVFTALTALVLAAALAASWLAARSQHEQRVQHSLETAAAEVRAMLAQGSVSDARLSQLEQQLYGAVDVRDGGRPLHFSGVVYTGEARTALLSAAHAALEDAPQTDAPRSVRGPGGQRYLACAVHVQTGAGACEALLLADVRDHSDSLARLGLLHLGIWLAGAAGLFAVNWGLAGFAIRPTAESLRAQTQFIAAASHELRSPLAVIRAGLAAAKQCGDGAQASRFLDAADREAARMGRLVGDLLTLASGDACAWSAQLAPLDLEAFLAQVFEQYEPYCRAHGHTLRVQLPDAPLPAVEADRERLMQLFGVLFSNACSYAPANTPVELFARCAKRAVLLGVADHGPGVPDADKARVFERFFPRQRRPRRQIALRAGAVGGGAAGKAARRSALLLGHARRRRHLHADAAAAPRARLPHIKSAPGAAFYRGRPGALVLVFVTPARPARAQWPRRCWCPAARSRAKGTSARRPRCGCRPRL